MQFFSKSKSLSLLKLLNNLDYESALNFIKKEASSTLNFNLCTKKPNPIKSIFQLCLRSQNPELVDALLAHPSAQAYKNDPLNTIFKNLMLVINQKEIYSKLLVFYEDKLSELRVRTPSITKFLKKIDFSVPNTTTPMELFDLHFDKFPPAELWRLFIDANKQREESGWLDYERREPGLTAMLRGFEYLKESITQPLSIELLKKLHKACSTGVENLQSACQPGKFRHKQMVGFRLFYNENISLAGLIEMAEILDTPACTYKLNNEFLSTEKQSVQEINRVITDIIDYYYQDLNKCTTSKEKLNVIIELIFSLERAHPFADANCRTICIFLLNRELIRNNLPPVILDDPNCFAGFSKKELFNEIYKGMKTFQEVKHGNTDELGMQTDDLFFLMDQDSRYFPCSQTYKSMAKSISLLTPLPLTPPS